jgi:hypothetical protein
MLAFEVILVLVPMAVAGQVGCPKPRPFNIFVVRESLSESDVVSLGQNAIAINSLVISSAKVTNFREVKSSAPVLALVHPNLMNLLAILCPRLVNFKLHHAIQRVKVAKVRSSCRRWGRSHQGSHFSQNLVKACGDLALEVINLGLHLSLRLADSLLEILLHSFQLRLGVSFGLYVGKSKYDMILIDFVLVPEHQSLIVLDEIANLRVVELIFLLHDHNESA